MWLSPLTRRKKSLWRCWKVVAALVFNQQLVLGVSLPRLPTATATAGSLRLFLFLLRRRNDQRCQASSRRDQKNECAAGGDGVRRFQRRRFRVFWDFCFARRRRSGREYGSLNPDSFFQVSPFDTLSPSRKENFTINPSLAYFIKMPINEL